LAPDCGAAPRYFTQWAGKLCAGSGEFIRQILAQAFGIPVAVRSLLQERSMEMKGDQQWQREPNPIPIINCAKP
jgi:hypothetical protein